ncbi:uncharacterized protein LAESUDRAFT_542853 [Laetiporus sulphureus 93-53]|uniref:BTB domain-containing protein n=1 Tax=Laetiporus sulphureus 93-53 TaxID=1314785 RepID=A0A165FMV7_9APHY|nr:uncharacterized protein LAESUDRAFT_542853 [Laetiporus sulphureus 93-53]KZT09207.1 hypothetical protein LAESUDRAFT_542853 [Laetiporus sulphureus 93-53]
MDQSHGTTINAPAPFNKQSADVILRSSDNVDFRVHTTIMSVASPFFETMFAMPQPEEPAGSDVHPEAGLPLIHMEEDSETLGRLLRFCYPVEDPDLDKVADLGPVLKAAVKYQMEDLLPRLKKKLTVIARRDPLRAYVLACSLRLEQEARAAAIAYRETSSLQIDSYVPEMDELTTGEYYRLLQFYTQSVDVASAHFCVTHQTTLDASLSSSAVEQGCLVAYFRDPNADVVLRSLDGMDFYVHLPILTLASPVISRMLDPLHRPSRQTISLPESTGILAKLLQLCYPVPEPEFTDWDELIGVLQSAIKYDMRRAVGCLKKELLKRIPDSGLPAYFTAMRFGWETEAQEAARYALTEDRDQYMTLMETVSAAVYRRFLLYRKQCRDTAAQVWSSIAGNLSPGDRGSIKLPPYWSETVDPILSISTNGGTSVILRLADLFGANMMGSPKPSYDVPNQTLLLAAFIEIFDREDYGVDDFQALLRNSCKFEQILRVVYSQVGHW